MWARIVPITPKTRMYKASEGTEYRMWKKNQGFREHAFSVSQSYFSLWIGFIIIFSVEKFYMLLCQHGQRSTSQHSQCLHGARDWLTGALVTDKEGIEIEKKERKNEWPVEQHQLATFLCNWCPRRKVGGPENILRI